MENHLEDSQEQKMTSTQLVEILQMMISSVRRFTMDILSIDLETYCDLDIKDVGAYKYCRHPSFEILLFAYAFNDEPVEIIDIKNR